MMNWSEHLLILPIVLPLVAGALMLVFDESQRRIRVGIGAGAIVINLGLSVVLLIVAGSLGAGQTKTYLMGNWPSPFGIVLVLDKLSALMLALTSLLTTAGLLFSLAGWHRAGVYFHPLLQFLLVGLNGAFLTGDLFNLFVYFEVLLAASYGLLLHGAGMARIKASMHYVVINLVASFVFLIGVSLLYGVTGTLNLADLANRIPLVAAEDRMLLEAGAAILAVAFFVKAAMWPLCFWLPGAYAAAAAPVAGVFAIMTKVGIYAILRLLFDLFGTGAGDSAGFAGQWLLYAGLATMAFGMLGVIAAQDLPRMVGFAVLVSTGTLLAAIGKNSMDLTVSALFYFVISVLAAGALYLLVELVERGREFGANMLAVTREVFGEQDEVISDQELEVGLQIPRAMAVLGGSFLVGTLLMAGLPPLAGFIAKIALLSTLLQPVASEGVVSVVDWAFIALIVLSGLLTLVAMCRFGISALWNTEEREVPRIALMEISPIGGLLLVCLGLTIWAEPALSYLEATARDLHTPSGYVGTVPDMPALAPLSTEPGP